MDKIEEILKEFDEFCPPFLSFPDALDTKFEMDSQARKKIKDFITRTFNKGVEEGERSKQLSIDIAMENLETCMILMTNEHEKTNLKNTVLSVLESARTSGE